MDQQAELTFKALNERIDAIPEHPSVAMGFSTKEKYGYAASLLAFALSLLFAKVLPDSLYTLILACFLLFVELIAIAVVLVPKWPPRFPGLRSERIEYAEQLDGDFQHYEVLTAWVAQFPRDQIADMADYAEMRQERFREKQPLLVGGVEKLGALPVIIAIAAQFRAMHWPPEISWQETVAYLVIAWLYWLCLISIGTRHRGRFLEIALKRALAIKDRQPVEASTAKEIAPIVSDKASTAAA
ncbi:hypothetical protein FHW84_001566 [Dyella sp. SG562]|uniref:hypothetical protein n=1 Tax=Dyella sp. SG562 TaxID=2587017 RepID=UPI001422CA24|nr:hypothetical protein [Dyella sp. SG562]NII72997.1 hypothetical protein [Dyella sp. SG562]